MCKCKHVTLNIKIPSKMRRRALPTVREEPVAASRSVGGRVCGSVGGRLCGSDALVGWLVAVVAVVGYAGSLEGGFVHDDIPAVLTNRDVTGGRALADLFLDDFWGTPMADLNSHKSYRPLTTLTFRMTYWWCGPAGWWWHAGNVALHAACCTLVWRAGVAVAGLQRPFAALAAVLFAVHPIHTEAVAGVVGRADVLACIFFMSSLLVYHRPTSNNKCVWLSIVLGALSMLAKETGLTVLLVNLMFDVYRCWPVVRKSISSFKMEKRSTGLSVRTLKVAVSLTLLVCLRLALLQGSLPTFSPQDNPAAFHPSVFVRAMTFWYLAALNWWALLCPAALSHDWQLGSVPLVGEVGDPRNLLTCAALAALLLLAYRCLGDLEGGRHTPAVLGLLMLVVPFLPASNLFVTVGFVIAERVLYIPSVGSVILTAYGAQLAWWSRPGARPLVALGLLVLVGSGLARTHRRNGDWRDRPTLLRADLATLPQNAKLHYNYANYLRETEQSDNAITHYREALRLWPGYASAHNNLGTLLPAESAERHFVLAIEHSREHVNAHYNLGKLYRKTGRTSEATRMFTRCVTLQPRFVQAYVELLGLTPDEEKEHLLRTLVRLEPGNWEHRVLYGNWMRTRGFPRLASCYYLEALRLSFRDKEFTKGVRGDLISLRSLALTYRSLGQKSRTLQFITRWHTWRRGAPSPAARFTALRQRLRRELRDRERLYALYSLTPTKSTKCFDHSQLAVQASNLKKEDTRKEITNNISNTLTNIKSAKKCECVGAITKSNSDANSGKLKPCASKKRTVSISTQIKTTHNKSEIGHKDKKCPVHRKDKNNVMKSDGLPNIAGPLADHILLKTF